MLRLICSTYFLILCIFAFELVTGGSFNGHFGDYGVVRLLHILEPGGPNQAGSKVANAQAGLAVRPVVLPNL